MTGSYAGAGYLVTTLNSTANVTDYARWLNLDDATVHVTWKAGKDQITRYEIFVIIAGPSTQLHILKIELHSAPTRPKRVFNLRTALQSFQISLTLSIPRSNPDFLMPLSLVSIIALSSSEEALLPRR